MSALDVTAIGEPLWELSEVPGEADRYLFGYGGDTSNAAIAAARLGARVAYVTRLGADAFGERFLALWRREGIDVTGVRIDSEASTGGYVINHTATGHSFSYLRAGSAASRLCVDDLPLELIRASRFVHVSAISQAISASACDAVAAAIDAVRDAGVRVSYDPNLRLKLWPLERARSVIEATIARSDIFLPSLDDARTLAGAEAPEAILDWAAAKGARQVVLKLGAEGALATDGRERRRIAGHRVDAVDATGAGDCFAGALLARLAAGEDYWEAIAFATAAAALTTTGYGAVAPLPTPAAVSALRAR